MGWVWPLPRPLSTLRAEASRPQAIPAAAARFDWNSRVGSWSDGEAGGLDEARGIAQFLTRGNLKLYFDIL